ncbi:MAG: hypothetical protein PHW14_06015, partial [Candidatus Omnitrophica bacterium]|nr:hypothetical protein [Candidatus Omnitrophota bacterium]
MKRHLSLILVAFMSIPLFTVAAIARTIPEDSGLKPSFTKVTPAGTWEIERSGFLPEAENPENKTLSSRVFFVHAENIPENVSSVSYGGALNLKYFSGLSYDYLQRSLPGKTFGLKVNIPKSAVSDFSPIPNKLRVTLKADRNGVWTEFFEGKEWTNVKSEGSYEFNLKIPSEAVTNPHGEMFYPEDTILLAVEYYLMEGAKRHSSVTYSISDIGIEGIDIDPSDLEWQFIVDGHAKQNVFLPSFPKGSDLIYNMGQSAVLKFAPSSPSKGLTPHSGELKNFFLTVPVYIPRELRFTKGSAELTVKSRDGLTIRSSVKNFDSCNIEGRVHLTVPLDPFSVKGNVEELFESTEITFRLTTKQPHTKNMMPFVIEPITARKGELIPFDNKWELHDVQGLGGYKKVDVNPNCEIGEGGAAAAPFTDSYQRTFAARMKGGIDWADNPYYKVELVRDLEDAPMDMDNTHFDVMISPLTDTEEYWQKPFRARLGLMDMNGNVMFGPNVSLSEGLSATASLDVSVTNPMPKGFVSPGFDPKRIRSIVLNFEASHSPTEIKDIKLQLLNLSMSPREFERPSPVKTIDYGRLPAGNPELWRINSVIKEDGGFSVGINYPFPVI